jgi:hypothetical protein
MIITINSIKEYASLDGTNCISENYIPKEKLKFICSKNHEYEMMWFNFRNNHRCSKCSGNKRLTIEYIKEFALKDGTICNSNEYKNSLTHLNFTCPNGHNYDMKFGNFSRGKRCIICWKQRQNKAKLFSYEYVKEYIESFGYKLLSTEYINSQSKLLIQCLEGHIYEVKFSNFKNLNRRCKQCFQKNNVGENHSRFKKDKSSYTLKRKVRIKYSINWIINNMKDDPNYKDFLNNNKLYSLDHIIPIKAFCDYLTENNLNENDEKINVFREIANHRNNLRLIGREANTSKGGKYNKEVFINYINEHSFIKNYIYS